MKKLLTLVVMLAGLALIGCGASETKAPEAPKEHSDSKANLDATGQPPLPGGTEAGK